MNEVIVVPEKTRKGWTSDFLKSTKDRDEKENLSKITVERILVLKIRESCVKKRSSVKVNLNIPEKWHASSADSTSIARLAKHSPNVGNITNIPGVFPLSLYIL